jgi:hypothetical protein
MSITNGNEGRVKQSEIADAYLTTRLTIPAIDPDA